MLAYIPYMDPMGYKYILPSHTVQNAKPAMSEARGVGNSPWKGDGDGLRGRERGVAPMT